MSLELPNLFSIGPPKTCGTSLNRWMRENTQWSVQDHDALDIVWPLHQDLTPRSAQVVPSSGECWTGMNGHHWKGLIDTDPTALYVLTVRERVDTWAASFWRHFKLATLNDRESTRTRSREILGIDHDDRIVGSDQSSTRLTKPRIIELIPEYIGRQVEQAKWTADNPNACVISLDGGTTPEAYVNWLYGRVEATRGGSALPWTHVTRYETSVGKPIYKRVWPHNRRAPEYEIPLWVVVECMEWDSMWQDEVISRIL
jgi:hypothetical protein